MGKPPRFSGSRSRRTNLNAPNVCSGAGHFGRSAPGKPASHFEKKPNWPGDREKPHMRPRHPTNLKLKMQKTTSAKRAIFYFLRAARPSSAGSRLPLSERPFKSRHSVRSHGCPLYPQKQTSELVECPLCAKSGHHDLFDHLISSAEQGCWNGNTKGPCDLKIDDQFERGRARDRQVAGFLTFQYAAGVDTSLPIGVQKT